jgi:hypothetical protein
LRRAKLCRLSSFLNCEYLYPSLFVVNMGTTCGGARYAKPAEA